MDHEISETLRDKLIREGLHAARVQSDRMNGVAGAAREEGAGRRPLPGSVGPGKLEMSMSRGRVVSTRPPLILIEGGRK